jgi:antirestriction protein
MKTCPNCDNLRIRCEQLAAQNAELIKERDQYDACRRGAMASCEEWRLKCWELEGKQEKCQKES